MGGIAVTDWMGGNDKARIFGHSPLFLTSPTYRAEARWRSLELNSPSTELDSPSTTTLRHPESARAATTLSYIKTKSAFLLQESTFV
jgi:hypothetical protein